MGEKIDKDCFYVLSIEVCTGDIIEVDVGRRRIIGQVKTFNKKYGIIVINDGSRDLAVRVARIYLVVKIS